MAYDANNLSALSYANGFTLWHYKTADSKETICMPGYFNEAAPMLRVGDKMIINALNAAESFDDFVMSNEDSAVSIGETVSEKQAADDRALSEMMRDPQYWRDRDPALVAEVTAGYMRLYGDQSD